MVIRYYSHQLGYTATIICIGATWLLRVRRDIREEARLLFPVSILGPGAIYLLVVSSDLLSHKLCFCHRCLIFCGKQI